MSPRIASMVGTSAGLRIGIAHIPCAQPVEGDALRLQSALLEPRTARPPSWLATIAGAIWRWL